MSVLSLLESVARPLRAAARIFVFLCLVFMVGSIVVQVIGRYVLFFRIGDAIELASFAQVWLSVIGAGLALRAGTIFAVDFLPAMAPVRVQQALSVVMAAAGLVFLGVVFYGSLILIENGQFQTSPVTLIPMWIIYVPMPFGMAFFALEIVIRLLRRWDEPFRQEISTADKETY